MSIITISRGSYSRGVEIAEKLARKLGYKCISREVLLKASSEFNVPETDLQHAIQDAPSIFDHIKDGKKRYVNFIRKAFLKHILNDNVVYHGYAGHFFTQEIPNILKIRILASSECRAKILMNAEKISEDEARKRIYKIDIERRKWSVYLYGMDTNSPELYDIIIHIDSINVDEAVNIIYYTATLPSFQITTESKRRLKELLGEAEMG